MIDSMIEGKGKSIYNQIIDLWNWSKPIALNSGFLIATNVVGAILAFVFWNLAAQFYPPTEVGLGAAYIAAMMLLLRLSELGLSSTVIRFLPTMSPTAQQQFINASLVIVAISSGLFTVLFIIGTPLWSTKLIILRQSALYGFIFLISVVIFMVAQFFDSVYTATESAHFLFLRQSAFHLLRIGAIIFLPTMLGGFNLILATGIASGVTFILSTLFFVPQVLTAYHLRPEFSWETLQPYISYSLSNYVSQLLWAIPLLYPLIVLALLGAETNAHFYISWMIASFLFALPNAISTMTMAFMANRADSHGKQFWQIMGVTLISMIPATVGAILLAPYLLALFGQSYVIAGYYLLILLLASALPYTFNIFVIVKYQIEGQLHEMIFISGFIMGLSLLLIGWFGFQYGLVGIGLGWGVSQLLGVAFILIRQRLRYHHDN